MTMLDPHLDVDQLSAAVDGDQDAAVSAHLLTCLSCRDQVKTWQHSLGQLEELASATSPASTDAMLDVAMQAWPAAVRVRRVHHLWPIAAAVAIIVVIAGGVFGLSRLGGPGQSTTSSAASSGLRPSRSGAAAGAGATSGRPAQNAPAHRAGHSSTGSATSPRSTTGSSLAVADRAMLRADLERDIRLGSVPAPVAASTPCLSAARSIAATGDTSTSKASGFRASFQTPLEWQGISGRVFLFRRGSGYIALVLRSRSCSLVASLSV